MDYRPVKCGELECEYSNACGAALAGFNAATECRSAVPGVPEQAAAPAAAIECPVGEGMCTMEYNPVKCGACEYSNPCGAELAGFNPATDCVSALPQCPEMAQGICTADYRPVKCGELECEYSNLCGAELAGFNPADCVSAEAPVPEQAAAKPAAAIECPVGEGMCTMEYNPVKCGACEYSNPCAARLAGFTAETDCVSNVPQCPEMAPGMCTMEYLPVKCGELECEYSNLCGAELAGFKPADCVSAASPVPEQYATPAAMPADESATQVFTSTTYEDPSLDEEDSSSAVTIGLTGSLVAIVALMMA